MPPVVATQVNGCQPVSTAWRRPGQWGGIPGKRRLLCRLDPKQENTLPTLRNSKPAACLQTVRSRRVEEGCPGFGLPDPDSESMPESEPELKLEVEPGPVSNHPQPPSGSYCAAAAKKAAVVAAAAAETVAEEATEETEDGRFFERTACLQQKQF